MDADVNHKGSPLTAEDLEGLKGSWITPELAAEAGLTRADSKTGRELVGGKGDCSGILFPYVSPDKPDVRKYRLRLDTPTGSAKYLGKRGDANMTYIPPGTRPELLTDTTVPAVLVEGEKKTLAVHRLAQYGISPDQKPRLLAIGLAGVDSWRGKAESSTGRRQTTAPIPDLDRISWKGRRVYICFDTDAKLEARNRVQSARARLAVELQSRSAVVYFVDLLAPTDEGSKTAIDDLLAKEGPDFVLALFDKATLAPELSNNQSPYQATPTGIVLNRRTAQGTSQVQLTTFTAKIVRQILLDDGVEVHLHYVVEARVGSRTHNISVSATQFASLNWVSELGPNARVLPQQREYARDAIQALSPQVEEVRIYMHTGWREVDRTWMFLHAGGAIGPEGPVEGILTQLSKELAPLRMPPPATGAQLVAAVRSVHKVLELAPEKVTVPVLASVFRAVLGGRAGTSVFIYGTSGKGKTELAMLAQQLFAAALQKPPANWSSTANFLEALCFEAKDMPLLIDDYVTTGSARDIEKTRQTAERVLRAEGNLSGRGRMRADGTLVPGRAPRGMILATGEDLPVGESLRARFVAVRMADGDMNWHELTGLQQQARDGVFARAGSAYIQWLASRYPNIEASLPGEIEALRDQLAKSGQHKRTATNLAELAVGWRYWLDFAEESGAITGPEHVSLWKKVLSALGSIAAAQRDVIGDAEPAHQFIRFLSAAMGAGRAHIADADGQAPSDCEAWGWYGQGQYAHGARIGWLTPEGVYIDLDVAFAVAQEQARASGTTLPVTQRTLTHRLSEQGLLASTGKDAGQDTYAVRKTLQGRRQEVLHFPVSVFDAPADEENGDEMLPKVA